MIVPVTEIDNLPQLCHFHVAQHGELAASFLRQMAQRIDFKLKIQKASIQLVGAEPFAVLGFRRSQPHIFLEFYHESAIEDARIVKTLEIDAQRILNRVHIVSTEDIASDIIAWTVHAHELSMRMR